MGQWTEYDIITGNPASLFFYEDYYINAKKTEHELEKEFDAKYNWNNDVVVLKKDGSFSKPGIYNSYGAVDIKASKGKKIKETFDISVYSDEQNGILIGKITYEYLKSHKYFKICSKKLNMYSAITKLMKNNSSLKNIIKIGPLEKYIGLQDVHVSNQKIFKNNYGVLTEGINAWALVNPKLKTKDGIRNNKRITKIIDTLMTKICADNRISHNKPKPSPKKSSCSKRNPSPPCKKDYEIKRNKKGGECCYKSKTNRPTKPTKPRENKYKKGCDLIIAQNVLNKYSENKLYYYRSKKKVANVKEALKIAASMIDNNC